MKTPSLILLVLLVTLTGCPGRQSPATKEGMVVRGYTAAKQTGKNIFVKNSTGGNRGLSISEMLFYTMSYIPDINFTTAVKESLLISQAFSALSTNWGDDWGLEIVILEVDHPFGWFELTVTTGIKYTVYLKGKKVYETYIRESRTATMDDAFLGQERTRMAHEKSAQANIKKFIAELSNQKLD
jgi:hypothetical protein